MPAKPITVTLGELQEGVEARVKSGAYATASEVLRAGLRALDREEAALEVVIRQRVQEALDDPRPSIPAKEVFWPGRRERLRCPYREARREPVAAAPAWR